MSNSKIVILEGMSTCGKTTVMTLMSSLLKEKGLDCEGFNELHTLSREVFLHVDPQKSIQEMQDFLNKNCVKENRIVVCDRFHLSHLAITNGSFNHLHKIEKDICVYDPLLVFLKIPDKRIRERLFDAGAYRTKQWEDELKQRGRTKEESVEWFKGTQQKFQKLFQESNLPKLAYDTDEQLLSDIALELVQRIANSSN